MHDRKSKATTEKLHRTNKTAMFIKSKHLLH